MGVAGRAHEGRATLGRLLFSGEETKKSVKVLSGGEKGRMIYGKLMLTSGISDFRGNYDEYLKAQGIET